MEHNHHDTVRRGPHLRLVADTAPLVYGYIRSTTKRPSYRWACVRVLERHCNQHGLRLGGVFADQGVAHDVVLRPGLAGLRDVLRLSDSFGALTPSMAHLSQDAVLASSIASTIRAAGGRLLLVRPGTATPGADGPAPSAVDSHRTSAPPTW